MVDNKHASISYNKERSNLHMCIPSEWQIFVLHLSRFNFNGSVWEFSRYMNKLTTTRKIERQQPHNQTNLNCSNFLFLSWKPIFRQPDVLGAANLKFRSHQWWFVKFIGRKTCEWNFLFFFTRTVMQNIAVSG